MSKIHVKYGLEFRPELYQSSNRTKWLEAVGQELEGKGVVLQLGTDSNPFDIGSTEELKNFYARYQAEPEAVAADLGLEPGQELKSFVSDLVQMLDDIVKSSSKVQSGAKIDLRPNSEISKMLGLDDSSVRYASSHSSFAEASSVEGSTSVLGVMLRREAVPVDPLEGQLYIDAATFDNRNLKSDRNSQEFEAVRRLGGLDKDQLIELLRTERGGRPVLRRIRKAKDAEAFSVGYSGISMDEIRWDGRAHRIREENPLVSLTVEYGRLVKDEDDGDYEVDLGTDYNEDAYYDTKDYKLLANDMTVRGRIRRDNAEAGSDAVRRVLIQSKIGSSVDDSGTKSAAKADIRKDNPSAEDIAGIDEDVRTGLSDWSWNVSDEKPIEAIGLVHKELAARGELPTIGEHKDVMQLESRAHVRSTRSRFHFNETSRSASVKLFQEAGSPNVTSTLEWVANSENLDPAVAGEIKALGEGILDKSLILERTKEALMELDPALQQDGVTLETIESLWPDKPLTADKLESKKIRVVADAIKSTYDEFANLIDENREAIAGADAVGVSEFDLADEFIEFMKSKEPTMLSITTVAPFLEKLDEQLGGPDKQALIDEFAAWAKDNGRPEIADAADKDAAFANLRKNMVSESLEIVHRQMEASGSMAQNLWFDSARKAFAGGSRSAGNFLIDTFDVSEFYTPEVWNSLTDEQRAGAEEVPADKMYHAMVVNEVQIELGSEKPFTEAVDKANTSIAQARAGILMDFVLAQNSSAAGDQPQTFESWLTEFKAMPQEKQLSTLEALNQFATEKGSVLDFSNETFGELNSEHFVTSNQGLDYATHSSFVEDLEMVNFVWGEMVGMQEYIADLRGRRVEREAERAGFSNVSWEDSQLSKGDTALTLIRDGSF